MDRRWTFGLTVRRERHGTVLVPLLRRTQMSHPRGKLHESNRSPDSTADQTGTPIPAVHALNLANKRAFFKTLYILGKPFLFKELSLPF